MNSTSGLAATAAKISENHLEEAIHNYRQKQQQRTGLNFI
jgi:hypothetical protein